MKTTVELSDNLMIQLKIIAAKEPRTVIPMGLSAPQAWLVQPDKGSRSYVITCAGLYKIRSLA